ncbi:MAG: RNA polymerase sigma factor [Rhodospirillales bacterium]|nr:RNA polymerase sigma factor [Rhodospirillales bacterium]
MFKQYELVEHTDTLRKFALRLTGNVADAEDLVQETVLRAIEKKHLFQTGTNLLKWTSKIMFNLFVTDYRRKTKFETQYDPETVIERQSVDPSQENELDLITVREAMKKLSPDHRKILVMVCIRGLKYKEVAKVLAIPVGTVRSRLARAREQLQAALAIPAYKEHTRLLAA